MALLVFKKHKERERTNGVPTITTLSRRLEKEMQKRKGAENEVKRLRQKCSDLEEQLENTAP